MIDINNFQWAMENSQVYYAYNNGFGIFINKVMVWQGDCDNENCEEIAHQLYAMKMGWTD